MYNESNIIVNEDVVEEILEIFLYKVNETAFQWEGYFDNDETNEIYSRKDAVEAIKRIELLK